MEKDQATPESMQVDVDDIAQDRTMYSTEMHNARH